MQLPDLWTLELDHAARGGNVHLPSLSLLLPLSLPLSCSALHTLYTSAFVSTDYILRITGSSAAYQMGYPGMYRRTAHLVVREVDQSTWAHIRPVTLTPYDEFILYVDYITSTENNEIILLFRITRLDSWHRTMLCRTARCTRYRTALYVPRRAVPALHHYRTLVWRATHSTS